MLAAFRCASVFAQVGSDDTVLQAEEGRSSGQPEEAVSAGEKAKVHQLSQHFPSTTQDVVVQAFRVCAGNLDMAIEVNFHYSLSLLGIDCTCACRC